MSQTFNNIKKVSGELNLPGDKSVSHRSVMFSALAKGKSSIVNLSNGEDVKTTQKCFNSLGVEIQKEKDKVIINGNGFKQLKKSNMSLDAGNSGTTTRLISGILVAQDFESEITGDESLSKRPMKRIIEPLTEMGGKITATENFTLPLKIYPSKKLHPINYELPVASAQVKSAVLLAGLHLEEETQVIEKVLSRDHTERMLGLKSKIEHDKKIITVSKNNYPVVKDYIVPSDISTAAFFIVLAILSGSSELRLNNVSLNETRTGIITILMQMGAKIKTENLHVVTGEPIGDIIIYDSTLKNISIDESIIPNIIDEIPILAIAGIFAEGKLEVRNAEELRGKETDRINAVCYNLKLLGLDVEEYKDGFSFEGEIKNTKPVFESFQDHRIAMAFGILSSLLERGGNVNNFECVNISNPDFLSQLNSISGQ